MYSNNAGNVKLCRKGITVYYQSFFITYSSVEIYLAFQGETSIIGKLNGILTGKYRGFPYITMNLRLVQILSLGG